MRRTTRGSVFILALAVTAGLIAILAATAGTVGIVERARINRVEAMRARRAAYSGIQYALSSLTGQSTTATGQKDTWATMGTSAYSSPANIEYVVGDGTFRVQVVDACSLVDLNSAGQSELQTLPLTQAQIDCLLDWRSPGDSPRVDGAKDSYYNSLPNPYNAKLARLDTLDELLQVQGFTRDTIYDTPTTATNVSLTVGTSGPQPTLASISTVDATAVLPSGGGRIAVYNRGGNVTQLTRQLRSRGLPVNLVTQIVQRRPLTSYGAVLRLPGMTNALAKICIDSLSVSAATTAEGRINVNTASQAVLNTLPGMTTDVADAIVTQQTTPLTSLGDLFDITGVTAQSAQGFIDSITVGSHTFLIRAIGATGNTKVSLEATVTLGTTGATITKIVEEPFPNMDVRWNWADVATMSTLVDPTQLNQQ